MLCLRKMDLCVTNAGPGGPAPGAQGDASCSSDEAAADKAITARLGRTRSHTNSQLIEGGLMSESELPACRARLARKMARNRRSKNF